MRAIYHAGPMGEAGIYCGGILHRDQAVIEDLRDSGFTTVIAWPVRVDPAGDLVFDDVPLVQGGRWVGDPSWPQRLASMKEGGTVNRLLFSVGSAESTDFTHIHDLMAGYGTGASSPLYRSFACLREAVPVIDGIDLDNEDHLDRETVVGFGKMLVELGWELTFCPDRNQEVWLDALVALWDWRPGCVAGFNLQCYSGGFGNDPGEWMSAIARRELPGLDLSRFVQPGLWCVHGTPCAAGEDSRCPDSVRRQLAAWVEGCGIRGGWLFLLEHLVACASSRACPAGPMTLAAYAEAIRAGIERRLH